MEVIKLHVHLGELESKVWFGVVNNLAVTVLLGTFYIYLHIKGIFKK